MAGRTGRGKKHKTQTQQGHPLQGGARVLYIHPAKQGANFINDGSMGRPYGLIPVGIPALINLLKAQGIEVEGVNCPMEVKVNPNFSLTSWLRARQRAQVILIDLHWYEHSYGALHVARLCRQMIPGAWIVLGGLTASGFSREILANFTEVDFIIRGDAEKALPILVQRLLRAGNRLTGQVPLADIGNLSYREGSNVIENERTFCAATADLDALDFTNLDFLEHKEEYFIHEYIVNDLEEVRRNPDTSKYKGRWILNARGCNYECSYCGGCRSAHRKIAGREGFVVRSPAMLVEDIKRLHDQGVIQVSLTHDITELGEAYWKEFFSLLRQTGIKIGLYNEFFQLPKPEFLDEFFKLGVWEHSSVALNPLSGSDRVRRINGKRFTNVQLFDTLEVLNQYNAYVIVYFSLNLPGENDQVVRETIELAKQVYDFYPASLLKILNTCHTIDPLCPMNEHPDKYGIEVSMSTFMDFYNYCRDTQLSLKEARTELLRGFKPKDPNERSMEKMADLWDAERLGKEVSWWPLPLSW